MPDSVKRVLHAVSKHAARSTWEGALPGISSQRDLVDQTLCKNPQTEIYGFTTLYGQLDRTGVSAVDQEWMLNAHTIGPETGLDGESLRLITAAKIEQLTHSFTGVSPGCFEALLGVVDHDRLPDGVGSWGASYGSGDVVPAAWWVAWLKDLDALPELLPGDLMALINGSFIAAGRSLEVLNKARTHLAEALTVLCSVSEPVSRRDDVPPCFAAVIGSRPTSDLFRTPPQLPVALRDLTPVILSAVRDWQRLIAAIDQRLANASGNPLFTTNDGTLAAVSNASFLDFGLADDLMGIHTTTRRCAHYLQRLLAHLAHLAPTMMSAKQAVQFIQPPKVVRALAERMSPGGDPVLPLAESEGVEDIGDGALLACQRLDSALISMADIVALSRGTLQDFLTLCGLDVPSSWWQESADMIAHDGFTIDGL